MILLMDLSYRPGSLSADEFVAPVERIVRQEGFATVIRHDTELAREDLASADGAILCGTALADCGYLDRMENLAWLSSFPRPVLGICAGMQVIAKVHGGDVARGTGIGMAGVEVTAPDPLLAGRDRFEAYELHSLLVRPPPSFRVLATSPRGAWNPEDGGPGTRGVEGPRPVRVEGFQPVRDGRAETHQGRGVPAREGCVQVIRHPDRPVYGVMFHPEVRNGWLISRFAALCGRRDALKEEGDESL